MSFSSILVDSLLDIGKNMNLFIGREKDFYKEQDLYPKPSKRQKPNIPKKKAPSSQEQYRAYENVLPTAKTISDFKLKMQFRMRKMQR